MGAEEVTIEMLKEKGKFAPVLNSASRHEYVRGVEV
jgi:hypothetical protein